MKKVHAQLGFTMIELLIVITILGILAIAVLSAINPIEQINRGRDTGRQSDAEQVLNAIDRFNAFQGYYPWQRAEADPTLALMVDASDDRTENDTTGLPVQITSEEPCAILTPPTLGSSCTSADDCPLVDRLSTGDTNIDPDLCRGSQEIKEAFVRRITADGARPLYVYNNGDPGGSTYVCFIPQSGAFDVEGSERCDNSVSIGSGYPDDVGDAARQFICDPATARLQPGQPDNVHMVCLP